MSNIGNLFGSLTGGKKRRRRQNGGLPDGAPDGVKTESNPAGGRRSRRYKKKSSRGGKSRSRGRYSKSRSRRHNHH